MTGVVSPRRVVAVTGTRSEYGILRPVFRAIDNHEKLELAVVATGMHLSPHFGDTIDEIESEFTVAAKVPMEVEEDTGAGMGRAVGRGILGMIDCFLDLCPEIVLVLGDRGEPFAASIAAAHLGQIIAHVHGGDVSGGLDESLRHATTKLAHLHFPATQMSEDRLLAMGERRETVHCVGAPGLDSILSSDLASPEEVSSHVGLDVSEEAPILVVQHPDTGSSSVAGEEMRRTLHAVLEVDRPIVVIHPNSDAGRGQMVEVIEQLTGSFQDAGRVKVFPTLEHRIYLGLLRCAGVLVGNSSSGIIEAASFGLPVVNVGARQTGREHGVNVIDVPVEEELILGALGKALEDRVFREAISEYKNPYGDGRAGERIAGVLAEVPITEELLQKRLALA